MAIYRKQMFQKRSQIDGFRGGGMSAIAGINNNHYKLELSVRHSQLSSTFNLIRRLAAMVGLRWMLRGVEGNSWDTALWYRGRERERSVEQWCKECRILRRGVESIRRIKRLCCILDTLRQWHALSYNRRKRKHRLHAYLRVMRSQLSLVEALLGWRVNHRIGKSWRLTLHGGEGALRALHGGMRWSLREANEVNARCLKLMAKWWRLWQAVEATKVRLCTSVQARWRGLRAPSTIIGRHMASHASLEIVGQPGRAWLE